VGADQPRFGRDRVEVDAADGQLGAGGAAQHQLHPAVARRHFGPERERLEVAPEEERAVEARRRGTEEPAQAGRGLEAEQALLRLQVEGVGLLHGEHVWPGGADDLVDEGQAVRAVRTDAADGDVVGHHAKHRRVA
jgi:hypothetical protein